MITVIIDRKDACYTCFAYKFSMLCRLVFPSYVSSFDQNYHQDQVEFPFQVFMCGIFLVKAQFSEKSLITPKRKKNDFRKSQELVSDEFICTTVQQ